MTVHHLAHFPLAELRPMLEAAGWDVTLADTLQAELRGARGQFRLVVDRSGRVILRRTTLVNKPESRVVRSGEHTYAVEQEGFEVTHISTQLGEGDDFGPVLEEMITLSLAPDGPEGD